jgi:N-acetylglucosaminyldiphosphoundecaprenol N-acetyl-beta-D-mannosaminyltransferase
MSARDRVPVLGVSIDAVHWSGALDRIATWAKQRASRAVYLCNAHVVVSAAQDSSFAAALQRADMALPDGMPVAWMVSRQRAHRQPRIDGPDLMAALCARAERDGLGVYLYGSTEATLQLLEQRMREAWPALRIAGVHAPPFRPLTSEEIAYGTQHINRSGAAIVFVGLGCPKQERWIDAQRGQVQAVMVGVGAAFDFHAGVLPRAPAWMRANGLEWLYRLVSEPRRLWRRYLFTNTAFLIGAARQMMRGQ